MSGSLIKRVPTIEVDLAEDLNEPPGDNKAYTDGVAFSERSHAGLLRRPVALYGVSSHILECASQTRWNPLRGSAFG